jgi:hypothetical protein
MISPYRRVLHTLVAIVLVLVAYLILLPWLAP